MSMSELEYLFAALVMAADTGAGANITGLAWPEQQLEAAHEHE